LSASRLFENLDLKKQIVNADKLFADAAKSAALELKFAVEATATAAAVAAKEVKDLHDKALEKVQSPSICVYIYPCMSHSFSLSLSPLPPHPYKYLLHTLC